MRYLLCTVGELAGGGSLSLPVGAAVAMAVAVAVGVTGFDVTICTR